MSPLQTSTILQIDNVNGTDHDHADAAAPNGHAWLLTTVNLTAATCQTTAAITVLGTIANQMFTMPLNQFHGVREMSIVTKLDYVVRRIG